MLIEGTCKVHNIGSNCCTTSMRTLMEYFHKTFTEEQILGFGAGLGFVYQNYKNDGVFVSGRNESIEFNFAHLLGYKYEQGSGNDFDLVWEKNCALLERKIPVIVDLNIQFLSYFSGYVKDDFRFGTHNALLVGYDRKFVYLLDHRWNSCKKIPFEEYRLARSDGSGDVAPRNGWRVVIPTNSDIENNYEYLFKASMETVISRMEHPFAFKLGLPGIKMFFKDTTRWLKNMDKEEFADNIAKSSFLIEKLGTGGGNFRRMYGRYMRGFLDKGMDDNLIYETGSAYGQLAKLWKKVSEMMNSMFEPEQTYSINEFEQMADDIYRLEELQLKRMERIVGGIT